jgi:hypothetical protein
MKSLNIAHIIQGMLQIVLPPIMYFLNAYPQYRKKVMWLGNLICCLAPIIGGLSTTVSILMQMIYQNHGSTDG